MSLPVVGEPIALRKKPLADRVWLGLIAWLAALVIGRPDLATAILLAAALMIVPLALDLMRDTYAGGPPARFFDYVLSWQPGAAFLLALAVCLPRGAASAALALPWFACTLLSAVTATSHLLWWRENERQLPPTRELATDAALLFLVVGGAWTLLYLLGRPILHFSDSIVQLTAIHFHYAAFVLPIVIGQLARYRSSRSIDFLLWAVLAAIPLLAVGITGSPLIEVAAATLLALVMVGVAIWQFRIAQYCPTALMPLLVSSVALCSGAALALVYAWGEWFSAQPLPIALMIPTHGLSMAAGFSLLGLLGWRQFAYLQPREKNDALARALALVDDESPWQFG